MPSLQRSAAIILLLYAVFYGHVLGAIAQLLSEFGEQTATEATILLREGRPFFVSTFCHAWTKEWNRVKQLTVLVKRAAADPRCATCSTVPCLY